MAQTTIELRTIQNSPYFEVFDFDYEFYSNSQILKQNFEKKFIQNYYFNEINSETVHRWKWMLKNKLDIIMPYYKQLYETELRSKNIDFMLNKDYEEVFEREVTSDSQAENISNSNTKGTAMSKGSSLNNGLSSVSLENKSLTNISENTDNGSNTSNSKSVGNDKQKEINKLIGKGNIGTTSSGQLLESWRNVLINIDQLILDELFDLFITVY